MPMHACMAHTELAFEGARTSPSRQSSGLVGGEICQEVVLKEQLLLDHAHQHLEGTKT